MRSKLLGLLLLLAACTRTPPDKAGVFVLGVDGMDPGILQRLMDEGYSFERPDLDNALRGTEFVQPPGSA